MKKFIVLAAAAAGSLFQAQFRITVEAPADFSAKEVMLYTLNGSKDMLKDRQVRKGGKWELKTDKPYTGMLKFYFPDTNASVNFITENKDVHLKLITEKDKIKEIQYLDASNKLMNELQDVLQKREIILPALYQIRQYYKNGTAFGTSLDAEISRLSSKTPDLSVHPFVDYYHKNYIRFLEKRADAIPVTHDEIIEFINSSGEMLETSSLLRPVLVSYLNAGNSANLMNDVDKLLKAVNVETPRGQTVMSELIEVFDAYGMKEMKDRYLTEAKNLKCSINDRLAKTITTSLATEVGSVFPDYLFTKNANTDAKSLHAVKADKKVIVFWASTCSHCESDLPKLIEKYSAIKAAKGEVIAFSLDQDRAAYEKKSAMLPWINDTELRGWNSSYTEQYNIHATPSYFVLDASNKIIAKPDHAADVISFLKLK